MLPHVIGHIADNGLEKRYRDSGIHLSFAPRGSKEAMAIEKRFEENGYYDEIPWSPMKT